MSQIHSLQRRVVSRPLRLDFATARGRKSALQSTLVRVELRSGATGLGEIPTSALFPEETPRRSAVLIEEARRLLRGTPIEERGEVCALLRRRAPGSFMACSGLEVALHRAWLAEEGLDELGFWGGRLRELETDLTVPYLPDAPAAVDAWLRWGARQGFRCYKLKVSGDPGADLAFVGKVYDRLALELGSPPRIRLDGNQGYSFARYLRLLRGLERRRIAVELFEQPLPAGDHAALRRLRAEPEARALPIYLDEDVLDAEGCARLAAEGLCDGVNLKVAKSGIAQSAAILEVARRAGLGLMIGCMTETMVGLSAGLALAAGSGAFGAIDLDAIHFLRRRPRHRGIEVDGPRYRFG